MALRGRGRPPALVAAPLLTSVVLSRQELFMVDLPWGDGATAWLLLHVLVALFGVLAALPWTGASALARTRPTARDGAEAA